LFKLQYLNNGKQFFNSELSLNLRSFFALLREKLRRAKPLLSKWLWQALPAEALAKAGLQPDVA
jgi:hypothetical protein